MEHGQESSSFREIPQGWLLDSIKAVNAQYSHHSIHPGFYKLDKPYISYSEEDSAKDSDEIKTEELSEVEREKKRKREIRQEKKRKKRKRNSIPPPIFISDFLSTLPDLLPLLPPPPSHPHPLIDPDFDISQWESILGVARQWSSSESIPSIDVSKEDLPEEHVFNSFVSNPLPVDRKLTLFEQQFILPPHSSFVMSDFSQLNELLQVKPKEGFECILMDPPWENKSVWRSQKYPTLPHFKLKAIPIPDLASHGKCIVGVWVTNHPKFERFVKEVLFPQWGVAYHTTWYWLKVTSFGKLVCPPDAPHRKPYEPLILGTLGNVTLPSQPRVIVSVPGAHSHKPPILPLLFPTFPKEAPLSLELFARSLSPHCVSWGNDVLHFQHSNFFKPNPTP